MWKFRACTLEIRLLVNTNHVSLDCEPIKGARVKATQELAAERVRQLQELVRTADLYGADHIGMDHTPNDGIFASLRLSPAGGGRAVVLVTSGNQSFAEHGARRNLLELLTEIETGLSSGVTR